MSVVLHEIAHGLGFSGSMNVIGNSGSWGLLGFPFIYDRFTEDNGGTALLNTGTYPNPSSALASALTSNAVFFDGSNANSANGGNRVELYAPSIWISGSSYSHLAEIFNNTPNALMTFSLANGESEHNPGPVTLGMFQDMGWNTTSGPDLSITKKVVGSEHQPGDPVTFTLTIQNIGSATATNVTVTDNVPTTILTPTWSSSISGTLLQSGTFVWSLPDLAVSDSGVITVSGVIDPGLPSDFAIVNIATITAAESESVTSNNISVAIVGGTRIFLPLVLK